MNLDHTLYPELDEPPQALPTAEDQADYLDRLCAAWDFGVPPTADNLAGMARWRAVFDRFPLLHSPAYHALRDLYGWPRLEPVSSPAALTWEKLDALEGREGTPAPTSSEPGRKTTNGHE